MKDKIEIGIEAKLFVSDEMADMCLRLLEFWQEQNADEVIVANADASGRTIFHRVKRKVGKI